MQLLCQAAQAGEVYDNLYWGKCLDRIADSIFLLMVEAWEVIQHLVAPVCGLMAGSLQVGLLDVDICGPSVPKLTGLENQEIHRSNLGWSPVYVEDNLAVMSIGFLLPNPDDAVIWRGPRKNGLIKQFLKVVSPPPNPSPAFRQMSCLKSALLGGPHQCSRNIGHLRTCQQP